MSIIVTILHGRKLRHREYKWLIQGLTAGTDTETQLFWTQVIDMRKGGIMGTAWVQNLELHALAEWLGQVAYLVGALVFSLTKQDIETKREGVLWGQTGSPVCAWNLVDTSLWASSHPLLRTPALTTTTLLVHMDLLSSTLREKSCSLSHNLVLIQIAIGILYVIRDQHPGQNCLRNKGHLLALITEKSRDR